MNPWESIISTRKATHLSPPFKVAKNNKIHYMCYLHMILFFLHCLGQGISILAPHYNQLRSFKKSQLKQNLWDGAEHG